MEPSEQKGASRWTEARVGRLLMWHWASFADGHTRQGRVTFEPTAAPEGIASGAAGGVGTEGEWAMSTEASEGSADNATGDVGL